jgi:hypothetical protein
MSLFNSWPLCLQLAHLHGITSLCSTVDHFTFNLRIYATGRVSVQQLTSTPAALGPDGIFICSFGPFAYARTLRTSVGGGTVTQNRAAVNTRTASNSPQVAANNDDPPLVEDDDPPIGRTRVWARLSPTRRSPNQRGPDRTSDVSIAPRSNQRDHNGSVPGLGA